jgi:septal ring factor EnvC (AmiA/AmiB activator)
MLIRISLIIAILAALAAAVVNGVLVRDKVNTLQSQRDSWHTQYSTTFDQLTTTKRDLAKTKADLLDTQQQLADSQAAEKKAEDTAAAQQKRADDLSDQLTKVTAERDDAQGQLAAYKATGQTPPQIEQLVSDIKNDNDEIAAINDEKAVLTRTVARLNNQIIELTGGQDMVVKLPSNLEGRVLVVDPKWDFVILDIGDDQGVLQDGEMLVSRDGKLVAKVIVRSVQKDRCIANIMPGWKLGDVFEGDLATPAHPAS